MYIIQLELDIKLTREISEEKDEIYKFVQKHEQIGLTILMVCII